MPEREELILEYVWLRTRNREYENVFSPWRLVGIPFAEKLIGWLELSSSQMDIDVTFLPNPDLTPEEAAEHLQRSGVLLP